MQNFNIVRKSDIDKTFRVAHIMGDFDLNVSQSEETFSGSINFPEGGGILVL